MEHIVIMAGGVGSRLYPVSTPERPKQFLDLLGTGKTLIRMTYERFLSASPDACFWVLTSGDYVHFVREQIPEIAPERILAEPAARNTAPCIAYACRKISALCGEGSVCVTPADAYVPDAEAFGATIRRAFDFCMRQRSIVCIGIKPDHPHTGYGYIHAPGLGTSVEKVSAFTEKPQQETAERYLEEGGYYWNAGIFVASLATLEDSFRLYAPGISGVMDEIEPYMYTEGEGEALARLFPECEKISIDYAVIEKSPDVYVLAADWEWSDLGSFEAIERICGVDPRNALGKNM